MARLVRHLRPALKHGGFSATAILPGEDPDEFKKLHDGLTTDLAPSGPLEDAIVANLARLMWRKQHLSTYWNAERARERYAAIRTQKLTSHYANLAQYPGMIESHAAAVEDADNQARKELGKDFELVGEKSSTIDRLIEELELEDRLDAMIERCLKRLLYVRGFKSLSNGSSPSSRRLSGPSETS